MPSSGNIAPGGTRGVVLRILGRGLSVGDYSGNVCVSSNDPANPKAAAAVELTVTP